MSKQELFNKKIKKIIKNKTFWAVFIIFVLGFFLRLYQTDIRYSFNYDQVVDAWNAKGVIVDHKFPLVGAVAKGNSGIYVGPLYVYVVVLFYYLFNLSPITYQVIAVLSAAFSFFALFYVTRKLFNDQVAIIAILINTFNYSSIMFDTIQWPVQLIPAISLIIFYLLYRVVCGESRKLIFLAIAVGVAFNLHFTAIFFPLIILLSLPIFPRTKETLKYFLIAIPFFIFFLIPSIINTIISKASSSNMTSYASSYYHGFHLRRMLQLTPDAFIQFESYLLFKQIKILKYLLIPLFFFVYLFQSFTSQRKKFCYLVLLWFLVPWLVFTTYSGEITDYYFVVNRFIVLLIISYLIFRIWNLKYKIAKIIVSVFLLIYVVYGAMDYLQYRGPGLLGVKNTVEQSILKKQRIEFQNGSSESYIYYYLMRKKGIEVY